jgi:hypothetical protein
MIVQLQMLLLSAALPLHRVQPAALPAQAWQYGCAAAAAAAARQQQLKAAAGC